MSKTIRMLDSNDYPHYEAMDTGIESDYVAHLFDKLTTGNNRLYGLFLNGRLVSTAGYAIYETSYVMLGRLRSDQRFKGSGFSSEIVLHVKNEALKLKRLSWVGANTQENNIPAQRVLEKAGLTPYITLYGAITSDTSALESGAEPWAPVIDVERKKDWIDQAYIRTGAVFPYECYHPFPGSADLFRDEKLKEWSFYENPAGTRFLIINYDQKKHHYLHVVYPWHDIMSQPGLWETIANGYRKLLQQTDEETYIWMDLTKQEVQALPGNHQFDLPSPWILYGTET